MSTASMTATSITCVAFGLNAVGDAPSVDSSTIATCFKAAPRENGALSTRSVQVRQVYTPGCTNFQAELPLRTLATLAKAARGVSATIARPATAPSRRTNRAKGSGS